MRRLVLLIITLGVVSVLYGNTFVMPDTISDNTTLDTQYDTVFVNNHVFVPKNALWVIGPGTVVYFTGPYYVEVRGEVQALGMKNSEVKFTADTATKWRGFFFFKSWEDRRDEFSEFKYSDFHYCVFENGNGYRANYSYCSGGAMLSFHYDSVALENCTFNLNQGVSGGAVSLFKGSLYVNNSTFSDNYAVYGGAIYGQGNMKIDNSTFANNIAHYRGGAIMQDAGVLQVHDSRFDQNKTDALSIGGGAIYAHCDSLVVEHSVFSQNASMEKGGGAITLNEVAYLRLANNMFEENYIYPYEIYYPSVQKLEAAGAMYFRKPGYGEVYNNSFVRNAAYQEQTSFFFADTLDSLLFYNNIVVPVDSAAQWIMLETDSLGHLWFSNNLMMDSVPLPLLETSGFLAENNIIGDPLFLGPANYRLQPGSPCINAGINAGTNVDSTLVHDLLGLPRIVHDTIDLGAYEFQLTTDTLSQRADFDDLTLPEDFDTLFIPLQDYFSYSLGFEWIVFSVQGHAVTQSRIDYDLYGSSLVLMPLPHKHGDDTLIISAFDGYGQVLSDTFTVSLWSVNDPPELEPLDTLLMGEFQSQGDLVHCFDFFDPDTGQVHSWQLVDTLGVFSLDQTGCLWVADSSKVDRHRYPLFEISVMIDDGAYADTLTFPVLVHWVNSLPVLILFPDTLYLPYSEYTQSCDTCFHAFDPDSALGQRVYWSMELEHEINCRISLLSSGLLSYWLYPTSKDSALCSVIHALITVRDNADPPDSVSRPVVFVVQHPKEENAIAQHRLDQEAIVIYPNPASESLYIESDLFIDALWLVNARGQLVYGKEQTEGGTMQTVELSLLPAGSYQLIIRSGRKYGAWQWMKE